MIKLRQTIDIPFEIDLREFYELPELHENDFNYELASICFHEGDGIYEGHYTSILQNLINNSFKKYSKFL